MPKMTIGNMSQFFQGQRHNVSLKTRLNTLTQELSSGRKANLTRALGSDATRFSHIERRLDLLRSYKAAGQEAAQSLVITQQVLGTIGDLRESLSSDLIAADFADSAAQRNSRMIAARGAFESMISALNTRFADRYIMSGTATASTSTATANEMIAALGSVVSGLTDSADIGAAVDAWFDDPVGGFATMGYLGDTGGLVSARIDEGETVTFEARADAAEIRDVLKATVKGFIGQDLGLPQGELAELIRQSGVELAAAGEALTHLAARVGATEARVEEITVRHTAEAASLSVIYNDMSVADPFETATSLQEVQTQLETHYALTARMSRLSLAEYLS